MGRRSATTPLRKPRAHQARRRPQTPPECGKDHALSEQLPDEPRPCRAECGANGQLALTRARSCQEQVGDVRAGDEQHESNRAGEHEERRANVAGQLLAQAHDPRRPAGIEVGKHLRQVQRDLSHVDLRAFDSNARLQTADDRQRSPARNPRLRREPDRQPDVHALVEKREAGRHDADDRVGNALRDDRFVRGWLGRRRSGASTTCR